MVDMSFLRTATRGQLAAAADLLARWDRHHANAARVARELQAKGVVFGYSPETTMCSEFMPGHRALLEAADPNDCGAVLAYIDAAFKPKTSLAPIKPAEATS